MFVCVCVREICELVTSVCAQVSFKGGQGAFSAAPCCCPLLIPQSPHLPPPPLDENHERNSGVRVCLFNVHVLLILSI